MGTRPVDAVEFVQAMADPDYPEHYNPAEWIGTETWDPAAQS
jgi:hypothetical protein